MASISELREIPCHESKPRARAEELEDDEDSDLGSEAISETDYQLGFVEEGVNSLHYEEDWREWDGGKVGGAPIWLDPVNLPSPDALLCTICKEPRKFLLQIYCPLDEIENAFHRSIYVFHCIFVSKYYRYFHHHECGCYHSKFLTEFYLLLLDIPV